MACAPANDNRPSGAAMMTTNQTALTGVRVWLFIRERILEKGSTPSRENAKAWRDAATTYTAINVNNKSEHGLPTKSKPIMYLVVDKVQ